MNGERRLLDLCIYPRGAAEMSQVSGETITDINAGGGKAPSQQSVSYIQARLWKQMRMAVSGRDPGNAATTTHEGRQLCRCAA